jgi:outer membrane protein assembly factor BamB
MRNNFLKTNFLVIPFTFLFIIASAQESGWRGPGRTGIYNEPGLMKTWPSEGLSMLWEVTGIGKGYSSATVTDDAIYITGKKGDKDVLTSFSQDGKKNWEVIYGDAPAEVAAPETRSTPTFYKDKIFCVSGQGEMTCVSKEGKIIWSVNYFKKYGAKTPRFGISESPLVVDDKVIGTPGGSMTSMVAFNVENGDIVWEAQPLNEGTNYVNPLLIEQNGMKLIVTLSDGHIIGVNADNGKMVWKFDYEAQNEEKRDGRAHINTPIYRDGYLFAANGYGQVSVKIKINTDGSDPELVWKNADINPHMGGMVLLGNYIYGSTHDNNAKGRWVCVDWSTGKTMWLTEWLNKGQIISLNGMLIVIEEKNGNVGLVKPGSEKFELVSSFKITVGEGPYWAHPVVDKGRLIIRHGESMAAFSLKAE